MKLFVFSVLASVCMCAPALAQYTGNQGSGYTGNASPPLSGGSATAVSIPQNATTSYNVSTRDQDTVFYGSSTPSLISSTNHRLLPRAVRSGTLIVASIGSGISANPFIASVNSTTYEITWTIVLNSKTAATYFDDWKVHDLDTGIFSDDDLDFTQKVTITS